VTTLAEITTGQEFLFACQVTATDTAGMHLALYGPRLVQAATALIAPDGSMTGQMTAPADQVPVTVVTGFTPVTPGDVLQNDVNGTTMVCRWSVVQQDGTVQWAPSADAAVTYPAAGWSVIAHISL
jgi:hypothetical protein